MKKLLIIISLILITGCNLSNTPTSKVEDLMSKYQKLDREVIEDIDILLENDNLNSSQKEEYKQVIERQYRNLVYEIKDEKIDGNNAIITIEIEVFDYKKVTDQVDTEFSRKETYTNIEYYNEKLDKLKKTKEKVTYTLDIDVLKDNNGNWKIKSLSDENIKKIQGMY